MVKGLNELREEATAIATAHGFNESSVGEDIALMHSELSEALEDYRAGRAPAEVWYVDVNGISSSCAISTHDKPCGIPSEMADVIIRVLHFCGKHGIDIEDAVTKKMAYNATRKHKHGGKRL